MRFQIRFSYRKFCYVLSGLLLLSLLGRFMLDFWVKEQIESYRLLHEKTSGLLVDNQNLLLKAKEAELAYQSYLVTNDPDYRLPFNVGKTEALDALEKLRTNSAGQSTAAVYSRVTELVAQYFSYMDEVIGQQFDSESERMDRIATARHLINTNTTEISQLLTFVHVMELERERILNEQMAKFQVVSFVLNTSMAAFAITLLVLLINGLRRSLFKPLLSMDRQISAMDEARPEVIKVDTNQLELLMLQDSFNKLIIKLKEHEQKLKQSQRQEIETLNQALKEKIEFSSVLAHEIRTPLNAIMGMLKLMERDGLANSDSTGHGSHSATELCRLTDELLDLVNSTLEYSRLGQGQVEPDQTNTELRDLAESIHRRFESEASNRGIALATRFTFEGEQWVKVDAVKLRQVLTNFVQNALKFTPRGGEVLLQASLSDLGDGKLRLLASVKDSGIGIKPHELESIFQPFKQANSGIKRQFGGTGIGLALCRRLVDCMGGQIEVQSVPGSGSEFKVMLDVEAVNQAEIPVGSPTDLSGLSGLRVLMVEDHKLNARINSKLFETQGLRVDWVESGEEALVRIQNGEPYSLILMDINLGKGLSGIETTQLLKSRLGVDCPPVIALTAGVVGEQVNDIFDAGMLGLIEKPFRMEEALATISQALKGRSRKTQAASLVKPAGQQEQSNGPY